jgi:hypothetical protein
MLRIVRAVVFLDLFEDPRMGLVGQLGQKRQVVAAKARRVVPIAAFRFVEATESHIVANSRTGLTFAFTFSLGMVMPSFSNGEPQETKRAGQSLPPGN